MSQINNSQVGPKRTLSLFDAVCIIVGTIIGAGIFQTAPKIALFAGSPYLMFGLWLVGGVITVIGALCFAELTTRFANVPGGDYGFLKLGYGRPVGFMFAWATFWIIRPGNMGAMALTFAAYFDQIGLLDSNGNGQFYQAVYTIFAIVVLSIINLIGLKQGKSIQNFLTVVKVLGIASIVIVALIAPAESASSVDEAVVSNNSSMWLVGLVFVMFSFGGWNDISFVATEVKSPEKNLFRSLVIGSLLVTAIYLVVNIAFVAALSFQTVRESSSVATDVVRHSLGANSFVGQRGAQIIAGLICISCLGAINGIIITSPRIYYAVGKDYPLLSFVGRWDSKRNQPWIAIAIQAAVTVGFCILCFQYKNPFEAILIASAPFFWAFLGMAGLAVIVLRVRLTDSQYPFVFRTPFYPLEPIVLAIACFAMTYSSFSHMLHEGYWVAIYAVFGMMGIGVLLGLSLSSSSSNIDN